MNARERLDTLIDITEGFITIEDAEDNGIRRGVLSEFVAEGKLERVDRGLYLTERACYDELAVLQHRFKKGIYSHETALFLHNLTTYIPNRYTMTFPGKYNASKLKESGIIVRRCTTELHEFGVTRLKTAWGYLVNAYDRERSICEYIRGNRGDPYIVKP